MKFPKRTGKKESGSFVRIADGQTLRGILRGQIVPFHNEKYNSERFKVNLVVKENGRYVAKIWDFGGKICDDLEALQKAGWKLEETVLNISRTGSTKENTRWSITPEKNPPSEEALREIEAVKLNILGEKSMDHQPYPDSGEMSSWDDVPIPGDEDLPF